MSQPKNDLTVDEYMEAFETRLKEVRNRETASSVPLPPVRNTRSSSSRARPAVSVKKNEEKKKNEEEEEKVNLPPYVRELLETKCPEWLAEWEPRVARNERKWMEERAAAVREGREFEFLRASDSEGEDDEVMGENPGVEEESDDELSEVDSAIFAEEEEEEKFDAAEYVEALVEEVCVEDDDTAAGAVATGNRMVILDYEWDGQWPFAEEVREKAKESGVKLSDAALYKYAENLLIMVQIESSMARAGLREYKGNSDAALDPARLDYNARYTPGFDTVIRFKRGINRLKMALKDTLERAGYERIGPKNKAFYGDNAGGRGVSIGESRGYMG